MSDLADDLADANAADLVDLLKEHPEDVDEVEAAEHSREGGPRKTVLDAVEKARGKAEPEPDEAPEDDGDPAEAEEPDVEPAEPAAGEPETSEPDEVTFVCDQWAGVSLFGKDIKFTDHRYVTSDAKKIGVLDAWEHARREA